MKNYFTKFNFAKLILAVTPNFFSPAFAYEASNYNQENATSDSITQLPFTDLDKDCNPTKNAECSVKFHRYDEAPQELKLTLDSALSQPLDYVYALPPIGSIKVYLGGFLKENEALVKGKTELVDDEEYIYLITINSNHKANYVRLGHKFTIGKDYSIIKTLDLSKKLIKYTIAPTGIIYKVK
jgi:hypothetical protein